MLPVATTPATKEAWGEFERNGSTDVKHNAVAITELFSILAVLELILFGGGQGIPGRANTCLIPWHCSFSSMA